MSNLIPDAGGLVGPNNSSKTMSGPFGAIGTHRKPTDPLYYAALTIQNAVANTRYRVTRAATGDQIATGTGGGGDITVTPIACYANPMLVNIRLRNASGATKYKPFETSAYIYKTGGSAYVIQVVD